MIVFLVKFFVAFLLLMSAINLVNKDYYYRPIASSRMLLRSETMTWARSHSQVVPYTARP